MDHSRRNSLTFVVGSQAPPRRPRANPEDRRVARLELTADSKEVRVHRPECGEYGAGDVPVATVVHLGSFGA